MSNTPNDPTRDVDEPGRTDEGGETGDDVRNSAPEVGKTDRGARSPDPETDRTDRSDRVDPADARGADDPGRGSGGDGRVGPGVRKWLGAVVALVGLWIAASPFVYGTAAIPRWNNLAVGGAIALLAAYNAYRMYGGYPGHLGLSSIVAVLGLWSIVAPFLLAFGERGIVWSTVASGIAVAALSAYAVYESRRAAATERAGARA